MRFKCRKCGSLFYQELQPLKPMEGCKRTLFEAPGMPVEVALRFSRPVGHCTIYTDLAGNYLVEMTHYPCGYTGPAVDATEAEMPRRGGGFIGPQ
jgi:hypothetical protein